MYSLFLSITIHFIIILSLWFLLAPTYPFFTKKNFSSLLQTKHTFSLANEHRAHSIKFTRINHTQKHLTKKKENIIPSFFSNKKSKKNKSDKKIQGTQNKNIALAESSPPKKTQYKKNLYERIWQLIEHEKKYPYQAYLQKIEGKNLIRFDLLPDGRIINIILVKKSNFSAFDRASLAAISAISPIKDPLLIKIKEKETLEIEIQYILSNK